MHFPHLPSECWERPFWLALVFCFSMKLINKYSLPQRTTFPQSSQQALLQYTTAPYPAAFSHPGFLLFTGYSLGQYRLSTFSSCNASWWYSPACRDSPYPPDSTISQVRATSLTQKSRIYKRDAVLYLPVSRSWG